MKKAALLVSLLLALFIAPSPSHAVEYRTVQTLLENCESNEAIENALCAGLISGVGSVLDFNCGYSAEGYNMPETLMADVDRVTNGALIQAFKNWARDNPENWGDTDLHGMVFAISSKFPCKD